MMSDSKAVKIKRFGLTEVYAPEDDGTAVAIIVFVHGLFGHPQRTWTGSKEPESESPGPYQDAHSSRNRSIRQSGSLPTKRLETAPEASRSTLQGGASVRGHDTPRSSLMDSRYIDGIRPGDVFWPQSILPTVLPETRIFTWGYDADIDAFSTSVGHNSVEQHAGDLLVDIANLQEKLGNLARPIIFVVHSLGGIVVKEALNTSSQSEIQRLKGVVSATYGISFLGTPHRGSGSATIGKHAYRIGRLVSKRPNIKLLRSLEKNSDTLKGISNRFRSTQQKWDIKISSFYEDREVRKFFVFHSLIVDNESAQIGYVGEEVSSIPKNHRDMTKFTSAEEVGFERVSSQLMRCIREIKAGSQTSGISKQELEDCLASLENAQTKARYVNVATSYDGTFQWLFDRHIVSFVPWLEETRQGPSPPVFWINGKPGSGKSTLMKFAMRDKRTQCYLRESSGPSEWILLGFFFHDRGSHIQKSIEGMLQAVLHQLLSQVPSLFGSIRSIYKELVQAQRNPKPAWTFDSLHQVWKEITGQRDHTLRLCIFLDALDEHEGDNNQLANFIYQLLANADGEIVKIKICVASRTWNIFGEHFGTCPQFSIHEHTAGDIQAYTSRRLSAPIMGLKEEARLSHSPKIDRLSSQVTTKARGVFIWVRIVVDELVKGIRDGTAMSLLEEKVSKMPEELGDLYRHTLERVEPEYAQEAYIMLQITLCSLSPLPLETFMKCVSHSRYNQLHDSVSEEETARQLASRSGGLLEIIEMASRSDTVAEIDKNDPEPLAHDDNHSVQTQDFGERTPIKGPAQSIKAVQFIHQTVKDFVAENRKDLGLHINGAAFEYDSGNMYLLACATNFGNTSWARELSRSMWEYAFLAEKDGISDMSRFYETFSPMLVSESDKYESYPLKGQSFIDWIEQELPEYYNRLLETETEVLFILLATAADLKGLLEYSFDLPSMALCFMSPLILPMAALGKRLSSSSTTRESMVRLLLKLGVDVNAQTNKLENEVEDAPDEGSIVVKAPPHMSESGSRKLKKFESAGSTLAMVLDQESQKHIPKGEEASLARVLLENGANPNVPIPLSDDIRITDIRNGIVSPYSLLAHCILYYNVEAVRLLLIHEAYISVINQALLFNVAMTEQIRGETAMSDVLREYGVQLRWSPENKNIPDYFGLWNAQLIALGSGILSDLVGKSHKKLHEKPELEYPEIPREGGRNAHLARRDTLEVPVIPRDRETRRATLEVPPPIHRDRETRRATLEVPSTVRDETLVEE